MVTVEYTLSAINWTDSYEDPYKRVGTPLVWVEDYETVESFWSAEEDKARNLGMVLTTGLGAWEHYYTSETFELSTQRVTVVANS